MYNHNHSAMTYLRKVRCAPYHTTHMVDRDFKERGEMVWAIMQ